jgi:hypothetical protein
MNATLKLKPVKPKPVAETVTLRRSEWEAFMEGVIDRAASRDYDTWVAQIGENEAPRSRAKAGSAGVRS